MTVTTFSDDTGEEIIFHVTGVEAEKLIAMDLVLRITLDDWLRHTIHEKYQNRKAEANKEYDKD